MIVTCQGCFKNYDIPSEIVGEPTFNTGEKGWWFQCENCQLSWWEPLSKKEKNEEKHQELRDNSSDTIKNKETSFEKKKIYPHFSQENFENSPPVLPKVAPSEVNRNNSRSSNHSQYIPQKEPKIVRAIIIFSLILITLIIIAISFSLYRNDPVNINHSLAYNPSQNIHNLSLKIRNVKYDVQVVDNKKSVFIVGEIYNPHNLSVLIKPLQISVWGEYPSVENNYEKRKLHQIMTWSYDWGKAHINSEEVIPFQTSSSVELNQDIAKVDVTLP